MRPLSPLSPRLPFSVSFCQLIGKNSRSNWQFDTENIDVEQLKKSGRVNDEGYVNVADQMGLSGIRGTRQSLY